MMSNAWPRRRQAPAASPNLFWTLFGQSSGAPFGQAESDRRACQPPPGPDATAGDRIWRQTAPVMGLGGGATFR
jgi:hypothetical protein